MREKQFQMLEMYKNILTQDNPKPFLYYYCFDEGKKVRVKSFTRKVFFSLIKRAACLLKKAGLEKQEKILHCFSMNDYTDCVFRHASTLTGTVPVTVNWQADTPEKVLFKYKDSGARAVLVGEGCNQGYIDIIKSNVPEAKFIYTYELQESDQLDEVSIIDDISVDSIRVIVYTSGTTGIPKGVQQTYKNYITNYNELFSLFGLQENDDIAAIIVNPLHHTNASAFIDTFFRKPDTCIHLMSRYSTQYWKVICDITELEKGKKIIAPVVAKHFEFLTHLITTGALPVPLEKLKHSMGNIDFVYGSAPAGPNAIKTMQEYAGKIPCVRYGSTETTLHVIGIPYFLDQETRLANFQKGWNHEENGEKAPGYYIGRAAAPYVEVKIVRSVDRNKQEYMKEVGSGQAGYIITRGGNVMSSYVNNPEGTAKVFDNDWYLNLGDIAFYLINTKDGAKEIYWMNRDVGLMIKGGANYSCDQVSNELSHFLANKYNISFSSFFLAAIGLKVESESEDSCCVTIELITEEAIKKKQEIEESFKPLAARYVSKGAKPDFFRFASVPRNFKGAILYNEMKKDFSDYLKQNPSRIN
ncbi:MAG TPA: hypothetical protein DD381_06265 [Lentisphaeria bacterium]|nr:MAG: hypothetical protein A2X47_07620 [Lentisphaerae bacterium GWF2_38_69]HBM15930.1 hypothetical protein [Lentisphaeria bacterium]